MILSEIAEKFNFEVDKNLYDLSINIERINSLKDANNGEVSFFENIKYLEQLKTSTASAVIISKKYIQHVPKNCIPLISKNPYIDLAKLSKEFAVKEELSFEKRIAPKMGKNVNVAPTSFIGSNVTIGNNVSIMHGSYIGDSVNIGDDTIIYPNVTIYKETIIGKNVIIHSGTVIGSDGFGFATNKDGEHIKIYHNGNVVIEDEVEIGSNTSIDRAVFNSTFIRKGARIDNLVQIGHNCDIGEWSVLVSQVGIAGSTKLGRNVVMGGQSASVGHIKIAPFTTITGRGGVTKTISESGKIWSGYPMFEHKDWLKLQAKISKLFYKG
jgi:UDP-3-O-[3-hydroxymyristoyl] glucosamine N-acyltransferase